MNYILITLLFFSTCLPPMQGLTDDVLMPKWYGVVMMGMVAATIHLILPKREDKVYRGRYMGSGLQMVAMLVLTYHLVYALVADIIMMDIPDMRFLYIKGVFDNPTGFALHTCVLMGVIKANRPSSRPPSMGEAFIEITGRRTIRQVSIILVWILTLLSAVMVVLSGCRTGMVCMAVIILLMLYREWYNDGRNAMQMNNTERAIVEHIADYGTGYPQIMAQALLAELDWESYAENPFACVTLTLPEGGQGRGYSFTPEDLGKAMGMDVSIKPNPATTWTAVDYTLPAKMAQATIRVTNALGVTVMTAELNGNQGQKVLDLRDLSDGVYVYTISCGEYVQTGKLVIAK